MKRWFEQRKPLLIVMGIVFVILALFVVSAYVTNSVNYVKERQEKIIAGEIEEEISEEIIDKVRAAEEKPVMELEDRGQLTIIITSSQKDITNVGENLGAIFKYPDVYFPALKSFAIFYIVLVIVLMVIMKTDKEYQGVEHGSAGWAEKGEEYQVLSKSEGFILAKDHYMPMIPNPPSGKNGNILVIRRFWFW